MVGRIEKRISDLDRSSRKFSMVRLGIVLGGLVVVGLLNYLAGEMAVYIASAVLIITFVIVARYHDRVEGSLNRHRIWRKTKSAHIARMTLSWKNLPEPSVASPPPEHPFDSDLNLTGVRSLHRLINVAGSKGGSERLRDWLLDPVTEQIQVRERQALVQELIPRSLFRDKLTLNGVRVADEMDDRWDGTTVCRWLDRHHPAVSLSPYLITLSLLSLTNLTLYLLYALLSIPGWWPISFTAYVLIYLALYSVKRSAMDSLDADASLLESNLKPFRSVLLYLESYPMNHTPNLAKHCLPLHSTGGKPSALLKEISWIAGGAKWQKGQLIWLIINALVPWDLYFTNRLHCFREQLREHLPRWLETWYDLEAYSALAGLGYQNPDAVMPEVVEEVSEGDPVFMTRSLAHPFLPIEDRVSNDFTFARVPDIAIVTGSNMSGKSTFLRTIGINLCLAYAGGPVLATSFRTIPFRLFASMSVSDSVTDGISYFYAEVKRLKALLDALETSHAQPLFFLIDEIFRGTNNRERLQGSRAYIRSVVTKHGVGIVATHDLELVNLEDEHSDIVNYHFQEDVLNGSMIFDYLLRKGPCPTTNALKIMQLEGLPVDEKLIE